MRARISKGGARGACAGGERKVLALASFLVFFLGGPERDMGIFEGRECKGDCEKLGNAFVLGWSGEGVLRVL